MARHAFTLVAIAVLALISSACSQHRGGEDSSTSSTTAPVTTTTQPRPVVGLLGDSLAEQVRSKLPRAMPAASVYVEAIYGLTANDAIPATDRLLSDGPAAVAVVLGTNDARDGATAGDDAAAVQRVADKLRRVPCVRWVTVNEFSRFPTMNTQAHAINEQLRLIARSRTGFAVVPWAAEIAQHPSWLLEDGLHHSETGQAFFARRLARALDGCLAELEASSPVSR